MNKQFRRHFDSSPLCQDCDACPVVDVDETAGTVEIFDPAKPENGRVQMTVEQFNVLLANAKPI